MKMTSNIVNLLYGGIGTGFIELVQGMPSQTYYMELTRLAFQGIIMLVTVYSIYKTTKGKGHVKINPKTGEIDIDIDNKKNEKK